MRLVVDVFRRMHPLPSAAGLRTRCFEQVSPARLLEGGAPAATPDCSNSTARLQDPDVKKMIEQMQSDPSFVAMTEQVRARRRPRACSISPRSQLTKGGVLSNGFLTKGGWTKGLRRRCPRGTHAAPLTWLAQLTWQSWHSLPGTAYLPGKVGTGGAAPPRGLAEVGIVPYFEQEVTGRWHAQVQAAMANGGGLGALSGMFPPGMMMPPGMPGAAPAGEGGDDAAAGAMRDVAAGAGATAGAGVAAGAAGAGAPDYMEAMKVRVHPPSLFFLLFWAAFLTGQSNVTELNRGAWRRACLRTRNQVQQGHVLQGVCL